MIKKLFISFLLCLIPATAFCDWKFNPYTGKQDYYEPSGAVNLTTSTTTNLTGFIKGNGSVLSADNSTYQPADADLTTYAGITPSANAQTLLGQTFAQMQGSLSIDHLITLSGMAESSDNLSTFTGSTIADNVTIKAALQALETAVEGKQASGSYLLATSIDTSSELATILTDEIGSGALVFANQPTFVTDIWFEGTTADDNETLIDVTDPTEDRTIVLPNASGTFAISASAPATLNSTTGDIGVTVLKDIVTTAPLTGAADNVLPGADSDLTLAITISKDIVAGVGLSGGEDNVLPGADADTTLTFAPSELEALTWGGGAQASIVHTFDVSGTDTTMTMGSATTTFSGDVVSTLDMTITGSDLTLGTAGVKLTGDGDGAITFLGLGNGSDEDLTLNLDDTANTAVISSSTGVTKIDVGAIALSSTANMPALPHQTHISIVSPNSVVTASTIIPIWTLTDAAITITKLVVSTSSASYEAAGDLKWADARIGLGNAAVIETFDTSSGVRSDTSIASGAVAAGKFVYLSFDSAPSASMTDLVVDVYWDYD